MVYDIILLMKHELCCCRALRIDSCSLLVNSNQLLIKP